MTSSAASFNCDRELTAEIRPSSRTCDVTEP